MGEAIISSQVSLMGRKKKKKEKKRMKEGRERNVPAALRLR